MTYDGNPVAFHWQRAEATLPGAVKMRVRSSRRLLTPALLVVLAPVVGCSGVGAHGPDSSGRLPFTESKPLVVPANTVLYVRLQESINAATAKAGQTFNAVLDQPLVVDEQPVA